ncbi:MAG: bL17 family ribosomal protein, partial [Crocinitomicaceae bacterium]
AELFRDVAPKISNRNGGYTRIIRTGNRLGDNAEMCLIELVDFNEIYTKDEAKKTTRRSRRAGAKKTDENVAIDAQTEITDEAVIIEENVDAVVENEASVEEVSEIVSEEVSSEAEVNTADSEVASTVEDSSSTESAENEAPTSEEDNKEESAS